jgi:hypothetical protein
MIKAKSSFERGFNPLSNPKHKTCWLRRANKKRNKIRCIICTRVNRDLLTSVLTSTCFLHSVIHVVEIVCNPTQLIFVRGVCDKERTLRIPRIFVHTPYRLLLVSLYLTYPYSLYYALPVRQMSYMIPHLYHKYAGSLLYSR